MKKQVEDFALFGGQPAFSSFRTTMNLVQPDKATFFRYAKTSFAARQMTNNGPCVRELERQLASFHGVAHCICFCNCFMGMFLALRALAIPGKTEVIVPSLTYRRMADIIHWAGLTPHFCDVDAATLAISPATARPCINENTALILAPHPITRICDIEGMERLAEEHSLPLFFDSVEACGGAHKGRKIGSFGACESFSMHPSKVLNACEGGYITTNNDHLAAMLRSVRAFGFVAKDHILHLGYNAKLNELHAAMGLASLCRLEEQMQDNEQQHKAYQKNLHDVPGFTVIPYDTTEQRNWKSLLVRLEPEWPINREDTLALLNAENIHARAYYAPPQHTTFPHQANRNDRPMPVTDAAAKNHLIMPFGHTMSVEDTAIVGAVLHDLQHMSDAVQARLHSGRTT